MDVARINLSHGTDEEHALAIGRVREADPTVAVLVDLPGPKIRLGDLVEPVVRLAAGDGFVLRPGERGSGRRLGRLRRATRPSARTCAPATESCSRMEPPSCASSRPAPRCRPRSCAVARSGRMPA